MICAKILLKQIHHNRGQFIMKYLILAITLAASMLMTEASRAASLTLVGGNVISGNQLSINNFGVSGTIQGLSAGYYSFALLRTPHNFTTQNLQLGVNLNYWSNFGSPYVTFIGNTPATFSISGIIPFGVECGEYETVLLNIYNTLGQVVISNTIKILNPTHQAPLTNFKINGNGASSPNVITFYNDNVPNNITLSYTGTGLVTRYRLYIQKASSNGVPVGPGSDSSWHNGSVPATIDLRAVAGGSFFANQLSTYPGYYSVKLGPVFS
jgi:hypothetical protein